MKKYDIVAKVGEYQKNGETKARYQNVGVVMEKDGKPFILLNRTFNPAALDAGKESVLLSLYEPKERQQTESKPKPREDFAVEELDDEIPF
jgi:hypothetical protein